MSIRDPNNPYEPRTPEWMRQNRRFARRVRLAAAGCFPAGTPVATPAGPRAIETLRPGELLLGVRVPARTRGAPALGPVELAPVRVRRRVDKPVRPLWRLVHEHGALETTPDQVLRAERGWVRAGWLRRGERLAGEHGARLLLRSEPTGVEAPVFHLIVAGPGTYLASGCVAHAFAFARGTRALLAQLVRR